MKGRKTESTCGEVEPEYRRRSLVLLVIITTLLLLGSSRGTLALDTTGAASTVGRSKSEVDVLLRVETDDEGRDVDDLLANTAQRS